MSTLLRKSLLLLSLTPAFASPAWADQAQKIEVATPTYQELGLGTSGVQGQLSFINRTGRTVRATATSARDTSHAFRFASRTREVAPDQTGAITFTGTLSTMGRHIVPVKIALVDAATGEDLGIESRHLLLNAESGGVRAEAEADFFAHDLALDDPSRPTPGHALGDAQGPTHPLDRAPSPDVELMERQAPGISDTIEGRPEGGLTPRNKAGGTATVKGKFTFKGVDGYVHTFWGWTVNVWALYGGQWKIIKSQMIPGSGNFSVQVPLQQNGEDYNTSSFSISATSTNAFVRMQRPDGYLHQAGTGNQGQLFNGGTHDVGAHHWDLGAAAANNPDAWGVGDVFWQAMRFWSAFYEAGINPIRTAPITLEFPNTSASACSLDKPWSCSYSASMLVYIRSEDAARDHIVQHELAHQINAKYWSNQFPEGAGGVRYLKQCTAFGTAVTEGFADFVPYWINVNRAQAVPLGTYDFNIETPTTNCIFDDSSEERVAGAFWDMHDQMHDGNDHMNFIGKGSVPATYLNHGLEDKMSDFQAVYQAKVAGQDYYVDQIAKIFDQNGADPTP